MLLISLAGEYPEARKMRQNMRGRRMFQKDGREIFITFGQGQFDERM